MNTEFSFIKHFIAIWALGCWSVISQIWDFFMIETIGWHDKTAYRGTLFKGMHYLQHEMKFQTFLWIYHLFFSGKITWKLFVLRRLLGTRWYSECSKLRFPNWFQVAQLLWYKTEYQIISYFPPAFFRETLMWGLTERWVWTALP